MKTIALVLSLAVSAVAFGQSVVSCPMHDQHQQAGEDHAAAVDARGDQAMGFSHEKSAHHFHLFSDGGAIEVVANDPNDTTTRDEIRMHLFHIAGSFADGNFNLPMFIHDTVPPGVPVMESKARAITYAFVPKPSGGQVRIMSTDPDAVKAIHEFLAFQIDDHRTGDPKEVVRSE